MTVEGLTPEDAEDLESWFNREEPRPEPEDYERSAQNDPGDSCDCDICTCGEACVDPEPS